MTDNQKKFTVVLVLSFTALLMAWMVSSAIKANEEYNADCVAKGGEIIKRQGETVCAKVEVLK